MPTNGEEQTKKILESRDPIRAGIASLISRPKQPKISDEQKGTNDKLLRKFVADIQADPYAAYKTYGTGNWLTMSNAALNQGLIPADQLTAINKAVTVWRNTGEKTDMGATTTPAEADTTEAQALEAAKKKKKKDPAAILYPKQGAPVSGDAPSSILD